MLQSQYPAAMSQVHLWAIAPGCLKAHAQPAAFTSNFNGLPHNNKLPKKSARALKSGEDYLDLQKLNRPRDPAESLCLTHELGVHFGNVRAASLVVKEVAKDW